MFDYLIVGSGLFGGVFAHEVTKQGRSVLILEKAPQIGGMVRTEKIAGIQVHLHGPHIFHTPNKAIWDYVNSLTPFKPYTHRVKALHDGRLYTLPFNSTTIREVSGIESPTEAEEWLLGDLVPCKDPRNLEEWALSKVGRTIYHRLIYGYTRKQWNRDPKDLPASILKRLPIRRNDDDRYFDDRFEGIPEKGYTNLIEQLMDGIDIRVNADFGDVTDWRKIARTLVYSGPIDELFDYRFGHLEYRSLRFEHEVLDLPDYQGRAIVNYTSEEVPYTRIVEHKHFDAACRSEKTVITREYPQEWSPGLPRYYPIGDERNLALYRRYKDLVPDDVLVGGRLGLYRYIDMAPTASLAINAARHR